MRPSPEPQVVSTPSAALRAWVRDTAARVLYAAGLTAPGRRARGRLTIVTFHRVLSEDQRRQHPLPDLAVTPEELDWFLSFFRQHFHCGTMAEALQRWRAQEPGPPPLAITFDDGQRDNLTNAVPVLARHGLRATFYVVAGYVGARVPLWHDRVAYAMRAAQAGHMNGEALARVEALVSALGLSLAQADLGQRAVAALKVLDADHVDTLLAGLDEEILGASAVPDWDKLLDADGLLELVRAGHELGVHSLTHAILPRCSDARLERETLEAKARLVDLTGQAIESFCYPNGDHDARVVAAVARAGYDNAVTTRFGLNASSAARYALRRCDMQSATARTRGGALSRARLALRLSGLQPGLQG